MPVELVAGARTVHPATRRRSALVFAAQLVAIVAVGGLSIALASLPSSSVAGSAQEVVAGP